MINDIVASIVPDITLSGTGSFTPKKSGESLEEMQSRVNGLRPGSQERKDLQRLHDELKKSS